MRFDDPVTSQANLLQIVSGGTYGASTRDVLHHLMTTECLGQLIMNRAHDETALAGTNVCSLVVGK